MQDHSSMKVCTDSCLFGAWLSSKFKQSQPDNILDIGTGTGLLSLMLAQDIKGHFIALEPHFPSYEEAKVNFQNSSFFERLAIQNISVQDFSTDSKFDLVVCNPPFYENHLVRKNETANYGLHATSLYTEDLANLCSKLIGHNGNLAILYPPFQMQRLIPLLAEKLLFPNCICKVKQHPNKDFFRWMVIFSNVKPFQPEEEDITICDEKGIYTARFKELLSPFYLYL